MKPLATALARFTGLVDRWHWLLLLAASPALLFPSPANAAALLILPVVWMAGLLAKREPFPRTPLNVALLVLCLMVLVSEWATFDLAVSTPKITGVVLGVGAFFATVRVGKTVRGWWLSLLVYMGIGVGFAVFGLMGTRWGIKIAGLNALFERQVLRIRGIPGIEEGLNPNQLAGTLLWVLPVLLVLCGLLVTDRQALLTGYGRRDRATVKVAVLTATLLVLFAFVLTESRSAYAGFIVIMLPAALVLIPRRSEKALLALLVTGVAGLGILLSLRYGAGFVETQVNGAPGSSIYSLSSLQARWDLWSSAIQGIQDFPITGMGMNTFRKMVGVLYPLASVSVDADVAHAHNEFLQAALDLGIPGLAAFLALYVGAFWMLLEIARSRQGLAEARCEADGRAVPGAELAMARRVAKDSVLPLSRVSRPMAVGLGAGLLAHLLFGLTDAMALGAKSGILFWMLLALIVGLYEMSCGETPREPLSDSLAKGSEPDVA